MGVLDFLKKRSKSNAQPNPVNNEEVRSGTLAIPMTALHDITDKYSEDEFAHAHKTTSVPAEYHWVLRQTCEKCGFEYQKGNTNTKVTRKPLRYDGRNYARLDVTCPKCNHTRDYLFDSNKYVLNDADR